MKIFLLIVLAVVALLLIFAIYMGAFRTITITEQDKGPFTLVYREIAAGELNKVGSITTALDTLLQQAAITSRQPLGVYYPDGTGEIGFAVEHATPAQLATLAAQATVRIIPAQRCMVTEFPWRNRGSFLVGFVKVDPALSAWREAHGYKKVEALAMNDGRTIVYMQPIVRP